MEAVSKHSTQIPKADHTRVWLEWFPMVYLDPGARYLVYLQPQQRMVPSKSPLQISNQNVIFSFHKSLFKKALLSCFLGKQRGYPRMILFLCSFQGFPQVQYSCRTLQMLKAPNMDPQNTGLVFLNHKKGEPNDAQTTRRFT